MKKPLILDAYGRPLERSTLTEEVMAATLGGVRSPLTGYSADGLNPERLARILREADGGDPIRYMELAQTIEERDLHYVGVLGTRRRSVSQLDITVEAAEEGGEEGERWAKVVRKWLQRDELQSDLFDVLDAIGKGYSGTEIIWDTSEGQWEPARLEWRDPRWFRFETRDLTTPMRLQPSGEKVPLEPGKFIWTVMRAKSGLPLRSGLARIVAWAWMFKAYTQRDWAIFTQTYGQPVRVGKWGTGASEEDKSKLFRAVANIAGDMAAIIPDTMQIEFIEAANVGAGSTLYKDRADWLDQQVSKAVLGQTATTDAVTGGLGSGKEHRQVQEDIERADAKALSATLNRELVGTWMALNGVPKAIWPRLRIDRPEQEDLKAFASAVTPFIDRGLQVSEATIREKFSLPEPTAGDQLLRPQGAGSGPSTGDDTAPSPDDPVAPGRTSPIKGFSGDFKRGQPPSGMTPAPQASLPSDGAFSGADPVEALTRQLEDAAAPEMARLVAQIEAMAAAATSLEELREMMLAAFPDLDVASLGRVIAQGLLAAHMGGRAAVTEEDDG
jgi:phage gp29-like protein